MASAPSCSASSEAAIVGSEALVAHQQVPVGVRVGPVAAGGASMTSRSPGRAVVALRPAAPVLCATKSIVSVHVAGSQDRTV